MAPRGFQDGNCFDFITLFQHIDQTSVVQSMVQGKGNQFTISRQKNFIDERDFVGQGDPF